MTQPHTTTSTNKDETCSPSTDRANATQLLGDLDANGVSFHTLGVATHLYLAACRNQPITLEQVGEEYDAEMIEAVTELLEGPYLIEVDGALFPPAPEGDEELQS